MPKQLSAVDTYMYFLKFHVHSHWWGVGLAHGIWIVQRSFIMHGG